ncbi:unnamed protein product [Amoebophrya sp. A120]|nr:unnamed protein product [Amoebophrya sp. A120]|eukprot:GSA120T00002169001.1
MAYHARYYHAIVPGVALHDSDDNSRWQWTDWVVILLDIATIFAPLVTIQGNGPEDFEKARMILYVASATALVCSVITCARLKHHNYNIPAGAFVKGIFIFSWAILLVMFVQQNGCMSRPIFGAMEDEEVLEKISTMVAEGGLSKSAASALYAKEKREAKLTLGVGLGTMVALQIASFLALLCLGRHNVTSNSGALHDY